MSYAAVQVVGLEDAVEMFEDAAIKLVDMREAQPLINQLLSILYVRRWQEWGGYLYDTGRLMRSWTETSLTSSGDALRRAHFDTVEYGSSVPYGRFHASKILATDRQLMVELPEAMADYYAGVRTVRGHMRGDVQVRPHLRRTASPELSASHG
jgi:hypothetical protein